MVHGSQLVDAAAPDPVGMRAGVAMEQDQEAQGSLGRGRRTGEHGAAGGDAGGDLGVAVHTAGEETEFKDSHGFASFLFMYFSLISHIQSGICLYDSNKYYKAEPGSNQWGHYERFLMFFRRKRYEYPMFLLNSIAIREPL
jgi:hypothetical protein